MGGTRAIRTWFDGGWRGKTQKGSFGCMKNLRAMVRRRRDNNKGHTRGIRTRGIRNWFDGGGRRKTRKGTFGGTKNLKAMVTRRRDGNKGHTRGIDNWVDDRGREKTTTIRCEVGHWPVTKQPCLVGSYSSSWSIGGQARSI
jgi:hypothetical protein